MTTEDTTGNVRSLFQEIANRHCARLDAAVAAKEEAAPVDPALGGEKPKKKPAEVVPFPVVWANPARAVPNGMLRSALFGVVGLGERRYMENERIAAQDGIEIFYTGLQLDQSDADVWQAVLHMCRHQAIGETCTFTAYELLKLLGRQDTGGDRGSRRMLDKQIHRLHACTVQIKVGRHSYAGHLIHHVVRDHVSKTYEVVLNPRLRPLFEREQYTLLDWEVRRRLAGKPLALWLHGFYASHAEPHALCVETLRELCGSEITRTRDFKAKLTKALAALAEVLKEHGQPLGFSFEGELVHIERTPSAAQRRHLGKKRGKKRKTDD